MYYLASCIYDNMLGYIQEAKMPKEAWGNKTTHKLQLRQELNNIQQRDMSIASYTLKIKELSDSLGSINVNINDKYASKA